MILYKHFLVIYQEKLIFGLSPSKKVCFICFNASTIWLTLVLAILGNMCIAIVCFLGCDVINFEINFIFLVKPFFYMTKKPRKKIKYLENEKNFLSWNKKHFSSF